MKTIILLIAVLMTGCASAMTYQNKIQPEMSINEVNEIIGKKPTREYDAIGTKTLVYTDLFCDLTRYSYYDRCVLLVSIKDNKVIKSDITEPQPQTVSERALNNISYNLNMLRLQNGY